MPSPKKQSKKLKFANVSGRKKIMLITVFAVVVVGAGVIIRSFAATANYTYSVANGLLKPGSNATRVSGGASKSGNEDLLVQPGGTAIVANSQTIPAGQSFQLCVVEKDASTGVADLDVAFASGKVMHDLWYGNATVTSQGNGYFEFCNSSGYGFTGLNPAVADRGPITISYSRSRSPSAPAAAMRLSSFTIKFFDSGTQPATK